MVLKKIIIHQFMGIDDKEIDFDPKKTIISGRNGSFKSTIATAYCWVLFDKNYSLTSNPMVLPINAEEAAPSVTLVIDVDGTIVTLTKKQILKRSKPDENNVRKTSITNTYECNSVPMAEKDFVAKLESYGFPNKDTLLACTHSEVFTSQKQSDMRKVLFGLTSEKTDLDIAKSMGCVSELTSLLEKYSIDEIAAMNKATIKKCNEQVESIPAMIIGCESSKVNDDLEILNANKKSLKEKIEANLEKIKSIKGILEHKSDLNSKVLQLEFKKNDISKSINDNALKEKRDAESKAIDLHNKVASMDNDVKIKESTISRLEDSIASEQKTVDLETKTYKDIKASTFDESTTICPTCGQEYPADKKESLKNDFESKKNRLLEECINRGKAASTNRDLFKEKLDEEEENLKQLNANLKKVTKEYEKASKYAESIVVENVNLESDPEYKKVCDYILKINDEIASIDCSNSDIYEIESENNELNNSLIEIERKIGAIDNNARIDEQIAELQESRIRYEQDKANAEKILYQLELLGKEKNTVLADEVNAHFKIVKFKLFEYLKNGGYKEVVIPMVGDKELGKSMNTALEMRAKLDIVNGFQKAYGINFPIILDNAECLDDESLKSIDVDSQIIFLSVSNNNLEVKGVS